VRAEPVLLLILGVALFTGLYSEAYDRLWSKHLIDLGLSGLPLPVWFGLISLVGRLLGLLAAGIARRIKANSRERTVTSLFWLKAGMVIMLSVFALGPSLWSVLLAMWIFDTLRGVSIPLNETWINQRITDSRVRATVISIAGQTDALGQLTGGPPLGFIGQRWGVRAALLAASALLLPAVGLLGAERRRENRTPDSGLLDREIDVIVDR
jgi:predicted MFS family arabinose efflux permease